MDSRPFPGAAPPAAAQPVPHAEAALRRLRWMSMTSQLFVLVPVGTLLLVLDSKSWWEAAILALGLLAAVVAVVRWAADDLSRVALLCLTITAAVWLFGALAGCGTAFYGLTVAGSLIIPQLPRHGIAASVGLTGYVAAAGATRLFVSDVDIVGDLFGYVLIPAGVAVLMLGFMFANQAFYNIVGELKESREREAELAVARERIRFASELHDIQGHTLHVVKLKTALAEKLVHRDADRAAGELREINALVGDTIKQTKELAYAQRRLNLAAELENAKNLFEAGGIRVDTDRQAEVATQASELLGQVLRETTTNILRHAEATRVRITLSESGISIVNDGVSPDAPPARLRGLGTLRQRVADNGGTLTAQQQDGNFRTAAELPHRQSGTREDR